MSSNCWTSGKQCRPDQTPRSAASDQVYTVCRDPSVQRQKVHKVNIHILFRVVHNVNKSRRFYSKYWKLAASAFLVKASVDYLQ